MAETGLSLIVVTLNEADIIDETLGRLQGLRHAGSELIIVDGGSQDDTLTRVTPLASRVIQSPPGRARQMNAGADAARGNHLVFLHADTQLPPHADRLVMNALSRDHRWGRFDIRLQGRHPMLGVIAFAMNHRSRLTGIASGDQTLFMTREAFDTAGGFPDQPLMEDIEMSRRLKRLSTPACLREKVTSSGRRWDRDGAWTTIRLMWRLRFRYWRGESPETLAREYRHVR
ncbi:TIGR04283 family arsenosugar biosynthesis glycosyltransferase [Chromohalobacter sarecensis]|uniref:TIGR04283 family arsenosugar biosynthesis glycosyltransferase n=1 Tax=Chromohalobacter sarecensis TaxID=245294 RepID=A0ABV9D1S4_9GAMM|nr:TIGR04283 family arsenosugar biosynthesis glycosyltransferase [Chromohalobacter sarecensis]MCK0716251.1 TIGR04283 family arsenosugar biosynthesis glycosyltransferase [Chromohalobacter sarecensis]